MCQIKAFYEPITEQFSCNKVKSRAKLRLIKEHLPKYYHQPFQIKYSTSTLWFSSITGFSYFPPFIITAAFFERVICIQ